MNRLIVIGNVGRDPESRYTPGGMHIADFSVAVTERRVGKDEKEEHTEWFNCTAFGKVADVVVNYVRKGSKVAVEGKVHTDKWNDKDTGKPREKMKVHVDRLELLGPKQEGAPAKKAKQKEGEAPDLTPDLNDDIPF